MRSVYDAVRVIPAVAPIAQAAGAATSVVIDTAGFNSALFMVQTGAATGTPTSYSVACKVQESDNANGSSASDISGATASLTADGKAAQIRVEGLGLGSRKRYLLLVMTAAFVDGTSPKALVAGTVALGNAYNEPTANSSTQA